MIAGMNRRDFITLLGGVAARGEGAQQSSNLPTVGVCRIERVDLESMEGSFCCATADAARRQRHTPISPAGGDLTFHSDT
jgi:hypothetical protein